MIMGNPDNYSFLKMPETLNNTAKIFFDHWTWYLPEILILLKFIMAGEYAKMKTHWQ